MDAQTFLDNFATIADAPGGVQRLRDLVLNLAFCGRLTCGTAGDPSGDFPGTADRGRPDPRMSAGKSTQGPFAIPDDWSWRRLDEIAQYNKRPKVSPASIPESAWSLDLEDIEASTSALIRRVKIAERPTKSIKSAFEPGDVLFGKLRPYLDKVIVADSSGFCTTEIVPITPRTGIDSRYLRWSLKRPDFRSSVDAKSYGMKMPRLGTQDALASLHPIPPASEQKRIVAKVDELMSLCDELESQQERRHRATARFRGSALHTLSVAENPNQLRDAWELVSSNWPAITHQADGVTELEAVILDLAVRGRLTQRNQDYDGQSTTSHSVAGWSRLPRGWRWQPLQELVDRDRSISYGVIKLGPDPGPSGVPILRCSDVRRMSIDHRGIRHIDPVLSDQYARTILRGGEHLVNVRGTLGGCAIVPNEMAGFNVRARSRSSQPGMSIPTTSCSSSRRLAFSTTPLPPCAVRPTRASICPC